MHPPIRPGRHIFAAWFVCLIATNAQEFRPLTNTAGKTIQAKVVSVTADSANVILENGASYTIPLASLVAADREALKTMAAASPGPQTVPVSDGGIGYEAVNSAVGQPLFGAGSLWETAPGEVAARLDWERESLTATSESYRTYPSEDYRFLGARPYSASLYGDDGKINSLSLVFANKGDTYAATGRGQEHFIKGQPIPGGMEGVRALMEYDAELIRTSLTGLLGEPIKQRFGEGESRVDVERWDWAGHAFLLSFVEDEYVSLAVQTTAFADNRGNSARVSDATIRERTRGFIERRENGDVVITNIPMVDQGPKGYCVPATAERCMRFVGIPADMYLLAMVGESNAGGGTSVDRLLSNIGTDIKRKGRSFDITDGELKMRDIKKSIDDGIPIIWALFSTKEFNEIANERTASRKTDSWESYTAKVTAAAAAPKLTPDTSTAHVVIIIGYNESTNELAFSDSWGEKYLERWITLPEAEQVSQHRFYIIGL